MSSCCSVWPPEGTNGPDGRPNLTRRRAGGGRSRNALAQHSQRGRERKCGGVWASRTSATLQVISQTLSAVNHLLKRHWRGFLGFPGGTEVKTLLSESRGPGSMPGQGNRSHMHDTTESSQATAKEPVCHSLDPMQPNKRVSIKK